MWYKRLRFVWGYVMLITDYLRSEHDLTWDYAKQCGVKHAVIRLPEDECFDICDFSHWKDLHKKYIDFGVKPVVIEPMPNCLHDHIKTGDNMRDESIEKVIKMMEYMNELDIHTICFNWMAHIGWLRTTDKIEERGKALVTGFDIEDFNKTNYKITEKELWQNYEYFIKAVIPYAEKYNIKLALHPDDPPIAKLGEVERIMVNFDNIKRAINIVVSDNLGVTFCQATYLMMGENLYDIIPELSKKIFFIHFRNAKGNKFKFNETFHDNGEIDMADIMKLYKKCGVDVPIRVDHVPLMAGENQEIAGYTALGRLYAIGYLKGILESI
ncbi:MAG: mannonate dehydratase [Clostridia bacterium]|nr:mannonate dehydratase [Clostridia bacterium]